MMDLVSYIFSCLYLFFVFCFLRFFSVRWLENGDVAKRAIDIRENMKAVIKWYK